MQNTKFPLAFRSKMCTFAVEMRYNPYNQQGEYDHYVVAKEQPLLEFLLENVKQSRNKIKLTLQGRGIRVNGKTVSQFDFPLKPGMKVAVSKTKRNQTQFKSRWLKIVYEDRWLIVIEKQQGILYGGRALVTQCEDGAGRLFQEVASEMHGTCGTPSGP